MWVKRVEMGRGRGDRMNEGRRRERTKRRECGELYLRP
jgi:hypothetical protein